MASYLFADGAVYGPVTPNNPFYAIQAVLSEGVELDGTVVVLSESGDVAGYTVERVPSLSVSTDDVDTMTRTVTYNVNPA